MDAYTAGDFLDLNVAVLDKDGAAVELSLVQNVRWGLFRTTVGGQPQGAPLLSKELGNGIAVTDGPAGRFRVRIENGDTSGMAGNYYHEAEIVDFEGRVSTVFRGQFLILPQGLL